jgi:hypothetical protein
MRAALAYRSIGLSPVLLEGKKPVLDQWPQAAATQPPCAAFDRPGVNVGMLCGDWSHLTDEPRIWVVAVDVDSKIYQHDPDKHDPELAKFAGLSGLEVLEMIEAHYGALPSTWLQLTPSGGRHYVYRHPGRPVIIPTRSGVWPGIDIRADANGQIAVSPSIHPNGGRYTWEASCRPGEAPLADLPPWLLTKLQTRAKRSDAATGRASESFLGQCFQVAGWLGHDLPDGSATACCPWHQEHSADKHGKITGTGDDSSTVIMPPTNGRPLGIFYCHHGHCSKRGNSAALHALPTPAVRIVATMMPDLVEVAVSILMRSSGR